MSGVDAILQGILDAPTEAECRDRISAALEQQSSAVQSINNNMASLNQIAESNASASEEITATVIELSRIADGTRQEVERFRT